MTALTVDGDVAGAIVVWIGVAGCGIYAALDKLRERKGR